MYLTSYRHWRKFGSIFMTWLMLSTRGTFRIDSPTSKLYPSTQLLHARSSPRSGQRRVDQSRHFWKIFSPEIGIEMILEKPTLDRSDLGGNGRSIAWRQRKKQICARYQLFGQHVRKLNSYCIKTRYFALQKFINNPLTANLVGHLARLTQWPTIW